MITNDLHVRIQDTSYGSITVITSYTSTQFLMIAKLSGELNVVTNWLEQALHVPFRLGNSILMLPFRLGNSILMQKVKKKIFID